MSAIMMIGMLAVIALALDLGVVMVARDELQRSADAAAMAACWELLEVDQIGNQTPISMREANARNQASYYAAANSVMQDSPLIADADIEVGYLAAPSDPNSPLVVGGGQDPNAVRVVIRRTDASNGQIPTFFARVMNIDGVAVQAEATAALLYNIGGFRSPGRGKNLMLLPFAMDEQTWNELQNGNAVDDFTWDTTHREVASGGDGIREVNLYPQGTGSPGNRGTVDIGSSNNSTNDLARQIVHGISESDLAFHGGSLEFNQNGVLELNADPGISAGMKDELASIVGKPRIIPIFRNLSGNGNNATYTIVNFAGIRIMEVKLTGPMNQKRVIIQPANVITRGVIPSTTHKVNHVYSPVWLVR